jgi:hypothetical protein
VLARACFALGDFQSSSEAAIRIPPGTGFDTTRILFAVQSLYALQNYQKIWAMHDSIDFSTFNPVQRNHLVWLTMESGLALGIDAEYSKIAGNIIPISFMRSPARI